MNERNKRRCSFCERIISVSNVVRHEKICERKQNEVPRKRRAWNKGLKKDTDERVAKNAASVAVSIARRIADGSYTHPKLTEEGRRKLSEKMSKYNHGGRCRWYIVGNEKVQGTWERNFAEKMMELDVQWTKKVKAIEYTKADGFVRRYTADFKLQELNALIEIKGFWWGDDREKMRCVQSQYTEISIIVVEKQQYNALLNAQTKEEFFTLLCPGSSV